jgi:hypothetical protein
VYDFTSIPVSGGDAMPSPAQKTRPPRTPPTADRRHSRGLMKHEGLAHLQAYLDAFARFVTAGKGDAIAEMWDYPALVVSNTQLMPVTTPAQTAEFFGGAKAQYNSRGIAGTRAEIQNATWLTDQIVSATVRWPWLDGNDNEIGEETSTYILRRNVDGELRMCAVVMHGAREE